ncbi:Efflux pump membrane transporter BepG [compost metagenome]
MGLLPLMLSTGVGAAGNKSIGTGAVGGMLIGTIFGIFVIPALFIVFQSLQERVSNKPPFIEGYTPEQQAIEFPEIDTREH